MNRSYKKKNLFVAILRSVDNMLNIFIPKLSPDIPETDDVYQIADEYTSADAVNGYDGSGFSPQERALFVSMSVAKYNEILNSSLDMVKRFKSTFLQFNANDKFP